MVLNKWLAAMLAFCLALASGASAFAADSVKFGMLRVPNALFVGMDKGYFAKEGITVEPTYFRSGAEVASQLAAGHIDIGATTAGATLYNAMVRGVPAKIVADYIVFVQKPSPNAVVVRKALIDSGEVKSLADLKGRTIAITARGQFTHLLAGRAMESVGLSDKEVKLVTMNYPDMVAAFEGGSIDAATFVDPFTTVAKDRGLAVPLVDAADLLPDMNLAVLMYGERMLKTDRDLGQRFMNAFHRANTTLRAMWKTPEGRIEISNIYQKYLPRQNQEIYTRIAPAIGREDLMVKVEGQSGLREQLGWYAAHGLVPEKPNFEDIVDNSFAEKAKKSM